LASNIFNDLQKHAQPKINDLQTFPEFSVNLDSKKPSFLSTIQAYCVTHCAIFPVAVIDCANTRHFIFGKNFGTKLFWATVAHPFQ